MTTTAEEIQVVTERTKAILAEYFQWSDHIVIGDVQNVLYDDVLDFVNFRIETAESCLSLIEDGHISDALGLCRSLLENYLLLTLICRGKKFFQLQDLQSMSPDEFNEVLLKKQQELSELHDKGESVQLLRIEKYPRAKRHVMYVYDGLAAQDGDGSDTMSIHYFLFREFRPEVMRLKDEDYFEYYEMDADSKKVMKGHRTDETFRYRNYLSYDALLECLKLNDIADEAALARIEAHYTFLGKFLHPTHEAARELHNLSNQYEGGTRSGLAQNYSDSATLLTSLYVAYLVASIVDEAAGLLEEAPNEYISNPGTDAVRNLTKTVPADFSYFWFLFNEAPAYDKFNYAIHWVNDEDLERYGHYVNVPSSIVTFDQNIHSHLRSALQGWSNTRVGRYDPPVQN